MNAFEQGLLCHITEEQLVTIQSKKIGIAGAGGLGSNVAMILVRSGFTKIEIFDYDSIDASNLNRQQYFINEIGLDKVGCLTEHLFNINPDIHIQSIKAKWTRDNAHSFFSNCDFIIEAFDQADWKYQFINYYQPSGIPIISGNGMAGLFEKQPMFVRKLDNVYFVGDSTTDTALGHPPMAPRVTACAAKMAEIILDLTLEIKPS